MATSSTTTTKPATKGRQANPEPVPVTEVEEYDFDGWTQEAEDAALKEMNDVKHVIVEGKFVGRFADGTIVKIPLELALGMIDELQAEFPNPVDQFKHLLRTFMGEESAADLDKRSLIPVAILAEKYFRALQRAQVLAFPES